MKTRGSMPFWAFPTAAACLSLSPLSASGGPLFPMIGKLFSGLRLTFNWNRNEGSRQAFILPVYLSLSLSLSFSFPTLTHTSCVWGIYKLGRSWRYLLERGLASGSRAAADPQAWHAERESLQAACAWRGNGPDNTSEIFTMQYRMRRSKVNWSPSARNRKLNEAFLKFFCQTMLPASASSSNAGHTAM